MTRTEQIAIVVLIAFIATFIHFVYLPEIMEWVEPPLAHATDNKAVCDYQKKHPLGVSNVSPAKVLELCKQYD